MNARTDSELAIGEFRSALGTGPDPRLLTKICLARLGDFAGANIGILYLSDHLAAVSSRILGLLKQATGIEAWVGTLGIGLCADEREVFDQPGIAVMVGRLPPDSFRLVTARGAANSPPVLDAGLRAWMAATPPVLGLVHADPRDPTLPLALHGLGEETGAYLVGGLASSRSGYRLVCGDMAEGGVCGVLFGPDVPVMTGLSQGCTPIGPTRTVTGVRGEMIETIDGRPALEVFKEDIGDLLARDLRRVAGYIFAALPVAGSDTGDYLVRNIVGLDPRAGMMAIGERVEAGRPIRFTRRDRQSAVQDLDRMLDGLTARLGDRRPRGAVYVSCVARGPNLFGDQSEELGQVRRAIGEVPLVGFFANGEISHGRLYGYTGVLTLFL
ncbi:MAG: histidine kinase [Alphaproteobacteria bacterium]|jgi:small ligand-binding sensory domain FIST|nr:histidine kinase [Alphaproteobacteria bacterium]